MCYLVGTSPIDGFNFSSHLQLIDIKVGKDFFWSFSCMLNSVPDKLHPSSLFIYDTIEKTEAQRD